ncbi:antirepressor AbbA [Bacillus sp. Marseille-P3661]|uniref:antirepressor AbbA n=1 Tax=Bacillus sp. Marseille-P3661 TaxID=1936234 RepID=UPI000C820CEB|nr:antirepressor AbbA [Bacillus sp. Marseille-P3661]
MTNTKTLLKNEDKLMLGEILLNQNYAIELVSSEIADIETGLKQADETRLKQLNELYDRLTKAGY